MMKRYYKQILILNGLFTIILIFITYNQYQENKMYEEYISRDVNFDMDNLVNVIVDNHTMYQDILESEEITNQQLLSLKRNNDLIFIISQEYQHLAVDFNRLESSKVFNETAGNAQQSGGFFP